MCIYTHMQKNKPQPPPQIIVAVKKQPEEMQWVIHIYVSETSVLYLMWSPFFL